MRDIHAQRRLRLLMVAFRYLPFMGGVETHVDQVTRRLAVRGVDVTILTTDPSGTLPRSEDVDGVHVKRVRAWPADRDYYFAPRIYSEVAAGDWDVVHIQAYHTFVGPLAMIAARRSRLPYVVTFHAGGHDSRLRHALRPLQLAVLRPLLVRADRLIALAEFEIDHYAEKLEVPRERFALISNGSDLPEPRGVADSPPNGSLIASIGRLERHKGHHRVIAAMPHVLARRPDARLWVAGSGPYEPSLRQLADELGISNRVDIHAIPAGERERMATELSRVNVMVSMSEFETQPIAALEALALGCRVLVADTPGLKALADGGLARSIPLESAPADVAAAVVDELKKPRVVNPPKLSTWDECADALLELYESVARAHRG